MQKQGISTADIDLYEVNEAFAMVPLAFIEAFKISHEIVNIHGGGVSLGHPIGVSGARIVTTLIHALRRKELDTGIAAICNGGGGASAMILEKV
jgi:acetyl-CoA C-acetyltransferase